MAALDRRRLRRARTSASLLVTLDVEGSGSVGTDTHLRVASSSYFGRSEPRGAPLAVRREPLPNLGASKAEELESQRGLEDAPGQLAVPAVECTLGEADRAGRAQRKFCRDLPGRLEQILRLDTHGDQPDPLGFFSAERTAGEQVVLGLRHAAEQGPADR